MEQKVYFIDRGTTYYAIGEKNSISSALDESAVFERNELMDYGNEVVTFRRNGITHIFSTRDVRTVTVQMLN